MFCPQCGYEYIEGVTQCADCGVDLVEALPEQKVARTVNLVKLYHFPSRLYAEMVQEALEKEGIESVAKGEDVGIFGGKIEGTAMVDGGASLWVDEHALERSKEIMDEMGADEV